jgi:hypothetical protein
MGMAPAKGFESRANISSLYNNTHYNNNTQHGAKYKSTQRTTLSLPGKCQCTHLPTVNVHNNRPIDSAPFAQPTSHNSTYHSPTIVHLLCNDSPASSTCFVSYIGRQYASTVLNVDIGGSSKCHTRHLATGGVARFNYVLGHPENVLGHLGLSFLDFHPIG